MFRIHPQTRPGRFVRLFFVNFPVITHHKNTSAYPCDSFRELERKTVIQVKLCMSPRFKVVQTNSFSRDPELVFLEQNTVDAIYIFDREKLSFSFFKATNPKA